MRPTVPKQVGATVYCIMAQANRAPFVSPSPPPFPSAPYLPNSPSSLQVPNHGVRTQGCTYFVAFQGIEIVIDAP